MSHRILRLEQSSQLNRATPDVSKVVFLSTSFVGSSILEVTRTPGGRAGGIIVSVRRRSNSMQVRVILVRVLAQCPRATLD